MSYGGQVGEASGGRRTENRTERPGDSAKIFVQMGSEVFVNKGSRGGEKALNLSGTVTKNDAMITNPEAMQSFEFIAQGFGVAPGQGEDGRLHGAPDFRGEHPLILAHLLRHMNLSRQAWRRDRT